MRWSSCERNPKQDDHIDPPCALQPPSSILVDMGLKTSTIDSAVHNEHVCPDSSIDAFNRDDISFSTPDLLSIMTR